MAKHEFGIMQNAPQRGERYDNYEPWNYNCISVDDDDLEGISENFDQISVYWHTLEVKGQGLAYCGITLIPPCAMSAFADVIKDDPALSELKKLSEKAGSEKKWMIHFGL